MKSDKTTLENTEAIILAAGRSLRMGSQKLLMPFRDGILLDAVIRTVLDCKFQKTLIVISRPSLKRIFPIPGAEYIVNPDPDRGQDSSLRCALETGKDSLSFAVFLGDKPLITASRILELGKRFAAAEAAPSKSALVPRRGEAPGHPAFYAPLWRRRFLDAEAGARSTLLRHADEVEWVEGSDECFFDVDTPEDYRRLIEGRD